MNNLTYEEIYKNFKDKLCLTISRKIKDKDEVEDLVQETLLKVYLNMDKYDDKYSISTWVYTIAFNVIHDYHRSLSKPQPFTTAEELYDNTTSVDSPENILIAEQTKETINKTMDKLPAELKEVFQLKEVDGLKVKDVAKNLGIPENTVKTRVKRARDTVCGELV